MRWVCSDPMPQYLKVGGSSEPTQEQEYLAQVASTYTCKHVNNLCKQWCKSRLMSYVGVDNNIAFLSFAA